MSEHARLAALEPWLQSLGIDSLAHPERLPWLALAVALGILLAYRRPASALPWPALVEASVAGARRFEIVPLLALALTALRGTLGSLPAAAWIHAVVVAAGALSSHIRGVVALSPQTYGANMAGQLSPRPLLVVHGKADTRLPYTCGEQIHNWAKEPKELVLYEGAEHRLDECGEELEELLRQWIPATLAAALQE